jgi:O26-antigen biosynthesis N-acetyl-L-fucosamine transferase
MRILLLVDCYLPQTKSSATQMHDLALEFRRRIHEVTVLTPSDKISANLEIANEEGLRVIRVRSRKIKGAPNVLRAAEEMRLSSMTWRRARRFLLTHPADLIVFYSPTIFWGALVKRLKSLWGCPAYLILRDIFPAWAVDAGVLQKGLVYRFFRRREIQQYEVADRIAVQSPANLTYFCREFPARRYPVEVLYNWASSHEEDLPATNYRKQLGLDGKVVFLYGGNLGVANDVDNVVRLAGRLSRQEHIHFLLVGDGSEAARLKRSVAENGLHNVQILPPVSHREYLGMLSEFDVGLLSLDRRLRTHNVPGKLLGYMYWSKPTLASINPGNDLFEILEKNHAGLCVLNGDDESLTVAALRLANDANLRASIGKNARRLLEEDFSVEHAVSQIFGHLGAADSIASSSKSESKIASDFRIHPRELAEKL